MHIKQVSGLQDYENNLTVADAVERRLSIIGEALHQIDKRDNQIQITNKSRIIGLRHILVHSYDLIESATIWNILQKHLPVLKAEVTAILNNLT